MKKTILFRTFVLATLVLFSTVFFTSCEKTSIENQTFKDVFDTSKIQALNDLIENSNTLADLPEDFSNVDIQIPDALNNVQISDLIASMEKNIKLSGSETDLLLQNDITTYENVITRIADSTIPLDEFTNTFIQLKSSSMNEYSLVQKQELGQYYVDDYYHSVLEVQSYMKDFAIQPFHNFSTLIKNTEALKSATIDKSKETKKIEVVIVTILKNIKELLDALEKKCKEEKEKKHKGSKGNNGNHYGNDK